MYNLKDFTILLTPKLITEMDSLKDIHIETFKDTYPELRDYTLVLDEEGKPKFQSLVTEVLKGQCKDEFEEEVFIRMFTDSPLKLFNGLGKITPIKFALDNTNSLEDFKLYFNFPKEEVVMSYTPEQIHTILGGTGAESNSSIDEVSNTDPSGESDDFVAQQLAHAASMSSTTPTSTYEFESAEEPSNSGNSYVFDENLNKSDTQVQAESEFSWQGDPSSTSSEESFEFEDNGQKLEEDQVKAEEPKNTEDSTHSNVEIESTVEHSAYSNLDTSTQDSSNTFEFDTSTEETNSETEDTTGSEVTSQEPVSEESTDQTSSTVEETSTSVVSKEDTSQLVEQEYSSSATTPMKSIYESQDEVASSVSTTSAPTDISQLVQMLSVVLTANSETPKPATIREDQFSIFMERFQNEPPAHIKAMMVHVLQGLWRSGELNTVSRVISELLSLDRMIKEVNNEQRVQ